MSNQEANASKALEVLLEYERNSLLQGALDRVEAITAEKIRLTELVLRGRVPDADTLNRIRNKAGRNQKLLAASVRAVRFVTGRMNVVNNHGKPLNTYTKSGRKQRIGGNTGVRFEQRS